MKPTYFLLMLLLGCPLLFLNCSDDGHIKGKLYEREGGLCLKGIYADDVPGVSDKECWKCEIWNEKEPIPLKEALDADSYEEIGNGFFRDKDHVFGWYDMAFCGGHLYEAASEDVDSWEQLGDSPYMRTRRSIIYVRGGRLEDVDRDSFEPLIAFYGRDKNHYYSGSEILTDKEEIAEVVEMVRLEKNP